MAHKAENSYCLALYRKSLPTSVAINQPGNSQGRNMFQKEGNEFKFGLKGTQIETSIKSWKTRQTMKTGLAFLLGSLSQKVIIKSLKLFKKEHRKGKKETKYSFRSWKKEPEMQ